MLIINFISFNVGVNLRTGQQGIFPSAYAVDMEYNDFDPTNAKVKRERYLLGYVKNIIEIHYLDNNGTKLKKKSSIS